jgi:hypothetical protein
MSDNAGTETNPQGTEGGTVESNGGGESGYTPPASQADLDRIITERLGRERAKYADYDDLKSKAERLDELEAEKQTDIEKLQRRAEEAERLAAEREAALTKTQFESMKSDVAREKGVPVAGLTGTTREELEASADELVKWRDSQIPKVKRPLRSGSQSQEDLVTAKQRAVLALRESF